jgi:hypothetical protein
MYLAPENSVVAFVLQVLGLHHLCWNLILPVAAILMHLQ